MSSKNTLQYAQEQDKKDALKNFRERFYFPQANGKPVLYFTGNSLGLQPKTTQDSVVNELEDWATFGVEGHFHARNPWFSYHEILTEKTARLVGAKPNEVVVMNQLTVNLHLLLVSFYRPTQKRYKIICEAKAFPSDLYALQSQIKFHGFDPKDSLIAMAPRKGEHNLRTEDILDEIEKHKNDLALVMFGGVNYYSGQVMDMRTIAEATHKTGAYCGFDLAHAAGNLQMQLHQWNIDFACWCSYKYLNSGPGGVAGVFVHEKHLDNFDLPLFAGWWGHDKATRFKMQPDFQPMNTVERWQLSNAPILSMAAYKASLDIFEEAGMDKLVAKSKELTAYLEFVIEEINRQTATRERYFEIITPKERGCQLSIVAHGRGKELFTELLHNGVISDWREPNVIRLAPVPLYNSFEDVYHFGQMLLLLCKK
ncbi:MAG TPA: kynureninase [Bacteroidia bacterium]|jgi:kynureninase|nr:kynureninase [Bacteroidia bacterium]